MSIKNDLLKEIEKKVSKKKQLSKALSREKTVARWVSEFFTEIGKSEALASLALSKLCLQLRGLDKKCTVVFKQPYLNPDEEWTIEITWSSSFSDANNCEELLVFDASTAHFQSAMEDLD